MSKKTQNIIATIPNRPNIISVEGVPNIVYPKKFTLFDDSDCACNIVIFEMHQNPSSSSLSSTKMPLLNATVDDCQKKIFLKRRGREHSHALIFLSSSILILVIELCVG